MSICNCNNNTVIGRTKCPADRVVAPGDSCPMAPTTIEFEVETPTNFISGLDGKSAYEYASEGGYEGDEQQFYNDLGSIGTFRSQLSDFDERLTEIEEHGLVGKYLLETETFEGLSVDDGTRVMYIGPTTEQYTNGYVYSYSAQGGAWTRVDLQPVPEIPDIEAIRTAVSTFNSFYSDKDYVDSTINKWEELRDFLEGMSDQDTLAGKMTVMKESLETQISGKQDAIIGAASTITDTNLTANRALVSSAQGKVSASSVSATELGYLSGVTGGVQSQIDGKQDELTFDNTPTANSQNPVTSDGIKRAIDLAVQQAEANPMALKQVPDLNAYEGEVGDIVQYVGPTAQGLVNGYVYKNGGKSYTLPSGTYYYDITEDALSQVGITKGRYYRLPSTYRDEVTDNYLLHFGYFKAGGSSADIYVPMNAPQETSVEVGGKVYVGGTFKTIQSFTIYAYQVNTILLDDGTTLTYDRRSLGNETTDHPSNIRVYMSMDGRKIYERSGYSAGFTPMYYDGSVYRAITFFPAVSARTSEDVVVSEGTWQQWNVQPETDISGKQDILTFDATPTFGSTNPVTSNGVRLAIDAASALNRLRFATAASVNNNLSTVDTSTYSVNDMLTITDLGSGVLRYMASGVQRTFTGPFDFDLMFRWTGTEFRPMFPFINWNEYN